MNGVTTNGAISSSLVNGNSVFNSSNVSSKFNGNDTTPAAGCSAGLPDNNDDDVGARAKRHLPFFFRGSIVHCFRRGGRFLSCPTANLDPLSVDQLPVGIENGVYAGFVRLDGETVDIGARNRLLPMVMSVGYNPQFGNKQRSLEVHVLRRFEHDFYGATMEGVAVRFVRAMHTYPTLDELMAAIESDKRTAIEWMTETLKRDFEDHEFFSQKTDKDGGGGGIEGKK